MIPGSDEVEKKILKQIEPSVDDERKLTMVIEKLMSAVRNKLEKYPDYMIDPVLVGSTAKGTYLRDSLDIDLFLVFSSDVSEKDLERIGLSVGRSVLSDREECYAQHPYVRGMYEGFETEIVPCYQIEDATEKRSAVDRTPLHSQYIVTHLQKNQQNQVRLFKQFLKGIGCYGADAKIEGFSGYLCELIILYYGSFQKVIAEGQNWKKGISLRLTDGKSPIFDTSLVFIDPVDDDRNVASALVHKNFEVFVRACNAYITDPNSRFFFPKPIKVWSLEKIKKELSNRLVVGVEFDHPDIIVENLYPQLRRATRVIADSAHDYGFTILDAEFYVTDKKVGVVIFPQTIELSATMLHMGPPVHLKKNAEEFLDKWQHHERMVQPPFEKDKRWYVEIKREFTSLYRLLDSIVPSLSLGKHMSCQTTDAFVIKSLEELLVNELRLFWTSYLDSQMPWER